MFLFLFPIIYLLVRHFFNSSEDVKALKNIKEAKEKRSYYILNLSIHFVFTLFICSVVQFAKINGSDGTLAQIFDTTALLFQVQLIMIIVFIMFSGVNLYYLLQVQSKVSRFTKRANYLKNE